MQRRSFSCCKLSGFKGFGLDCRLWAWLDTVMAQAPNANTANQPGAARRERRKIRIILIKAIKQGTQPTCASSWNRSHTYAAALMPGSAPLSSPVRSPSCSQVCKVQPTGSRSMPACRCKHSSASPLTSLLWTGSQLRFNQIRFAQQVHREGTRIRQGGLRGALRAPVNQSRRAEVHTNRD